MRDCSEMTPERKKLEDAYILGRYEAHRKAEADNPYTKGSVIWMYWLAGRHSA